MPVIKGLLQLELVSLHSSTRIDPVLNGITLSLRPGGLYVVVGSEASGKSALAKVLCGAERNHLGVVKLDGMAYRNYGMDQLSRQVSYLPQTFRFTPTTVFEFIGRDSGANEEDVFEAAKHTGADPIIRELSHGYQTQMIEDQIGLSFGQLRRIALASAIFRWPNLLVLDEPMLGLDAQGEHDVLEVVRHLKSLNRTVIVISGSAKLVHLADELIFLEQGRLQGVTDGSALRSRIGPRSIDTF